MTPQALASAVEDVPDQPLAGDDVRHLAPPHLPDGLLLQDPPAVELAHADESEEEACELCRARPELAVRIVRVPVLAVRAVSIQRHDVAIRHRDAARVQTAQVPAGLVHRQRHEDPLVTPRVERGARGRLHDVRRERDGDIAVAVPRPRMPGQEVALGVVGPATRREVAGEEVAECHRGIAVDVHVGQHVPVVGDRGRVGQQHPRGDPVVGKLGITHRERQDVVDVGVQIDQPVLDRLHDGHARDGLGDRGKHELDVLRRSQLVRDVRPAVASAPDRVTAVDDGDRQARDPTGTHLVVDVRVEVFRGGPRRWKDREARDSRGEGEHLPSRERLLGDDAPHGRILPDD